MGELMRPLDELARLGNDTLARMPRASFLQVPWSWPLAAAAGGALLTLVGTGSSQDAPQPSEPSAAIAAISSGNCQEQTWPYISDACLQRAQPTDASPAKPVRVIQPDEAMAKAAIGTTEWTRRAASSPNPPPTKQKSRQKERGQDRVVTVRPSREDQRGDRRGTRERTYVISPDAYRAYGHAPR